MQKNSLIKQSLLTDCDHGFDAYGQHLGQENHLTFPSKKDHKITLRLVDMRESSDTLFAEEKITFTPHPNVELVIPCGVAHALINMAGVITVNRPVICLSDKKEYIPGHDVIDWPIMNRNYLGYKTNKKEADTDFYAFLLPDNRNWSEKLRTPKSVVVFDESSDRHVNVLLKEKAG